MIRSQRTSQMQNKLSRYSEKLVKPIVPVSAALTIGVASIVLSPTAHAGESVRYEVVSANVFKLNVEYFDGLQRRLLEGVTLPWQIDIAIANPRSTWKDGAQVRADWRPAARPGNWVTVRIYLDGELVCQNTLDVGNATCYGSTPHIS